MFSLVIDTETTGFTRSDYKDKKNGKVVQLYAALYDHDPDVSMIKNVNGSLVNSARPIAVLSTIINQNMVVPQPAFDVHGINRAWMGKVGCSPAVAVNMLADMLDVSDTVVAHNIAFDVPIIRHLFWEFGSEADIEMLDSKDTFCTMRKLTPIMALPPKKNNEYRWPNLPAAYNFIFDRNFTGEAHDASADGMAAADVYFGLLHIYTQSPAQRT